MSTVRYEVHHFTLCDGWANTWSLNDVPQTFASEPEAQAEIDSFLADIQEEIEYGERDPDNGYSPDEFRIAPIECSDDGLEIIAEQVVP